MLLMSTLWGLRNPGDGGRQIVTIDPSSAAITTISSSIAPPNGTPSGVIALDREGNRFFFTGTPGAESTPRLYAVDTTSGAVLSNPAIEPSTSVQGLEYDEAEDVLYGLRTPAASAGKELVRYDVGTGVATAIGPASTAIGMPSGVTTLDAGGNRFFFIGTQGSETTQRLYTVNTATGAIVSSPEVDSSAAIIGLEYDDADNVLYALRTPLADGGKQVVSLNAATGAATIVSTSIGPSLGIASGVTAIDGAGNRFYFVATPSGDSDSRIYTVNTTTGTLVSSPVIAGSAARFFQGLAFEPAGAPAVITISIDVIPHSLNPRARGVIPVVIFTTPSFDATKVAHATVRFGPGNTREIHNRGHISDVDGDGDKDVLYHFGTPLASIPCGATTVSLTGQTTTGQSFTGFDAIRTVGCK
jgi:hypothetical protein